MLHLLFEVDGAQVIALSPRLPDGSERQPSDIWLTAERAAEKTGRNPLALKYLWLAAWRDELSADERQQIMDELGAQPASEVALPESLDLLRAMKYPELDDREYAFLAKFADQHGLNLWSRQVAYRRSRDRHTHQPVIEPIVCIEAIRMKAHGSGLYAGCDDTIFDYGGDNPRVPVKATKTVYRLVQGARCAWTKSVFFDEYAPMGDPEIWGPMPHESLGRCAEVGALRMALGDVLGGMFIAEEMRKDKAGVIGEYSDDDFEDSPTTARQLELKLINAGVSDARRRSQIIGEFRTRLGMKYASNPAAMYAAAWRDIQENPESYGIAVAGAAMT